MFTIKHTVSETDFKITVIASTEEVGISIETVEGRLPKTYIVTTTTTLTRHSKNAKKVQARYMSDNWESVKSEFWFQLRSNAVPQEDQEKIKKLFPKE